LIRPGGLILLYGPILPDGLSRPDSSVRPEGSRGIPKNERPVAL
jgi:hypothetical protein